MNEAAARLTRSMLFVPGSRPDMIAKAARSAADALCLDLEDAVAPEQKEAARAHGLRCLDGPYADFQDAAGLERACRVALALGFDGKQCIHPAQLATVNHVFAPAPDEVAWARAVVAAYEQARAAGRGVVSLQGKMIDAANVRMAQTILQRQAAIADREREGAL